MIAEDDSLTAHLGSLSGIRGRLYALQDNGQLGVATNPGEVIPIQARIDKRAHTSSESNPFPVSAPLRELHSIVSSFTLSSNSRFETTGKSTVTNMALT